MRDRDRNLVCAIRGPITLITVGILFALNNFTLYTFDKTWPVLLIVFGLLSLLRRGMQPVVPAPAPAPPYPPPQYAYPAQASSYSQSTYSQPPPAKGGFGTSASRPADGGQNPPAQPGDHAPGDQA